MAAGGLLLDEPDEPEEDPEPDEEPELDEPEEDPEPDEEPELDELDEPDEPDELSDFAGVLDAPESALASDGFFSAGLSEVALAGRLSFL